MWIFEDNKLFIGNTCLYFHLFIFPLVYISKIFPVYSSGETPACNTRNVNYKHAHLRLHYFDMFIEHVKWGFHAGHGL